VSDRRGIRDLQEVAGLHARWLWGRVNVDERGGAQGAVQCLELLGDRVFGVAAIENRDGLCGCQLIFELVLSCTPHPP
jgi:hypothetical protein